MKFHFSRDLKCCLFFMLSCCNSGFASSNFLSSSYTSLILTITIHQVPSSIAFPFDFLFRGRKDDVGPPPSRPQPQAPSKPPRYYELASKILDWAFNELDESDEEKSNPSSPRFDVDKMASSSEEDEEEIKDLKNKSKELNQMTREIKDLKKKSKELSETRRGIKNFPKRRRGATKSKGKKKNRNRGRKSQPKRGGTKGKETSVEVDDTIESASVQELKHMLNQMKREEEGIFSSNILSNPLTRSLFSFGTNVFKTMYCGWSPSTSYCIPDRYSPVGGNGPASIFDGIGRALAILDKDLINNSEDKIQP